ncbi:MAG TPA: glycosyltransferase family 4 protein [Solirubrobacteraceae bacterium]|nr:glycosyltransferase family 4 protein [Solirubrobacteraceae bacterium]
MDRATKLSLSAAADAVPAPDPHMRLAVIEPLPFAGLLHYSTQLADALAERGNEVDLIVARENELARLTGPARRRELFPPDAPQPPRDPSRAQRRLRRARTAARMTETWLRIARETRRSEHDAILLGGSFDMAPSAAGGLLATHLSRDVPIAHVCHNVRPFNRWGGENLYVESPATLALLRRLYASFDVVFVHGEHSRREYESTWPPPKRLATIPHGDERLFGSEPPAPSGEPRILFFGAWRKMKGLPVLMDAFDILSARDPDVRLTIAGPPVEDEGESERVLAWASERRERVEVIAEYVAIEDVSSLFARARAVVLPYITVNQSGVAHLAMTMARAVVATDVGDLPEVVENERTGLLVPPGDADALAHALARLVGDPALAARLGEAGHARMRERAGWPEVAARVERELLAAAAERAGGV